MNTQANDAIKNLLMSGNNASGIKTPGNQTPYPVSAGPAYGPENQASQSPSAQKTQGAQAGTSKGPVDFGEFVSRLLAPVDQSTGAEGAIHAGLRTYLTAKNPELAKEMEQDVASRQQVWQRAQNAQDELTRLNQEQTFQTNLETQREGAQSALTTKELEARRNERINSQTFEANQNALNRTQEQTIEASKEKAAIKLESTKAGDAANRLERQLTSKMSAQELSAWNAAGIAFDKNPANMGKSPADRVAYQHAIVSASPVAQSANPTVSVPKIRTGKVDGRDVYGWSDDDVTTYNSREAAENARKSKTPRG